VIAVKPYTPAAYGLRGLPGPHWTVHPSPGELCSKNTTLAQADGTRSKTRVLLLKGGTYLETGKHDSLGKDAMCPVELFSPKQAEPEKRGYFRRLPGDGPFIPWLKPRGFLAHFL
jgi:hypothetical protein